MNKDEAFMKEALKQARIAFKKNEVPVGAVVVKNGKIISRSYNMVERSHSQLGHAELIALKKATKKLKNWRLTGCTIYVTLQPCLMCIAAISFSRISAIIYGAKNPDLHIKSGGRLKITGGILKDDCSRFIKDFFKKIRRRGAGAAEQARLESVWSP